jgi:hypothetical protein
MTAPVIFRERASSGADDRESATLETPQGRADVELFLARHAADRRISHEHDAARDHDGEQMWITGVTNFVPRS